MTSGMSYSDVNNSEHYTCCKCNPAIPELHELQGTYVSEIDANAKVHEPGVAWNSGTYDFRILRSPENLGFSDFLVWVSRNIWRSGILDLPEVPKLWNCWTSKIAGNAYFSRRTSVNARSFIFFGFLENMICSLNTATTCVKPDTDPCQKQPMI